jgi:hypothetical protein
MVATITLSGIEFDIEFNYQPEEPMVMYYKDGSGYPGCASEVTLNEITHKGTDFMEFLEDREEEIKKLVEQGLSEESDE